MYESSASFHENMEPYVFSDHNARGARSKALVFSPFFARGFLAGELAEYEKPDDDYKGDMGDGDVDSEVLEDGDKDEM